MLTLIKYRNRKIYQRGTGQHVDLDYIIELVNYKTPFKVVEFDTDKDVTMKTLKHALLKLDVPMFSLKELIRSGK